jgi:hypothetical protein
VSGVISNFDFGSKAHSQRTAAHPKPKKASQKKGARRPGKRSAQPRANGAIGEVLREPSCE